MTAVAARLGRSGVASWVRSTLDDPLYRSAFSLMTNTAMTSALGVVFWVVAARLYPSSAVGRDSALISAMMGISVFCQLNLNNVLARFLPVTHRVPARMVASTYALTATVSLAAAVGFVVMAPRWSSQFDFLRDDHALAVAFCISLPLWAVFTLQDSVLTALRRAPWVVVENAVFGVLKIAGLVALFALGVRHGVFVGWAVPVVFITIVVNAVLFRRVVPEHAARVRDPGTETWRFGRPALIRFLAFDYVAWVLNNGIERVMPLVVVALLGSRVNAYFYIAFTISTAVDMLLFNVGTSLTVEGAMAEDRLVDLTRRLVRRLVAIFLVGALFLTVGAPLVLLPFGASYAKAAAGVLRLLAVASLFRAVVVLYTTLARVRGRGGPILAANVSLAVLLIAATVTFGSWFGLNGVGIGWLLAHVIVAVSVLPSMWRLLHAPAGAESWADPEVTPGELATMARAPTRRAFVEREHAFRRGSTDPALEEAVRRLSRSLCADLDGACPPADRALYERVAYASVLEGYDITRVVLDGNGAAPSRCDATDGDAARSERLVRACQTRDFGPLSSRLDDIVERTAQIAGRRLYRHPVEGRFATLVAVARRRGVELAIAEQRVFGAGRT